MTDATTRQFWVFLYRRLPRDEPVVRIDRDQAEILAAHRTCRDIGYRVGQVVLCELPTPDATGSSHWRAPVRPQTTLIYAHTFRLDQGSIWAIGDPSPGAIRRARARQRQGGYVVGPGRIVHVPDIT